jgi:hypothetical protein
MLDKAAKTSARSRQVSGERITVWTDIRFQSREF